jgi:copper(I)-binding protein
MIWNCCVLVVNLLAYSKRDMKVIKIVTTFAIAVLLHQTAKAQDSKQMVRLAKLVIDSTQLNSYNAFLKEVPGRKRQHPVCR